MVKPNQNIFTKYKEMYLINSNRNAAVVPVYVNNTFIGGVASTINTPALLAAKLLNYPSGTAFSETDIHNFTIVGSDIECYIGVDYLIQSYSLNLINTITHFIDDGNFLKKIGTSINPSFGSQPYLTQLKIEGVVSIVSGQEFNTSNVGTVNLPNCTSIINSLKFVSGTIYNIPKCTTLGSTVGNDNIISNKNSTTKIYANPYLQTNNSGSPDGDLQAVTSVGGTIVYVLNQTAPSPITNLSVGNVYGTAIQLNFTPPTGSTNAIDFYEVWVNGRYNNKGNASGLFARGLMPSTVYTIEVKPVDIFYNKSTSNTVTQTTSAIDTTPESASFSSRVSVDGGVLVDQTYIEREYVKIIANNLNTNLIFWHNNFGGVKKDGSNFVEKLYSFTNANTDIIQLTQANKPLYTATGINFDVTDEMTKTLATSIVAPTFTIMFKVKAVPGNYYPIIAFQSWDAFTFHSATGGNIYAGNSVSIRFNLASGSLLNNVTATYTYTYNSTSKIAKIYRDTTLLGSMTQTDPIARTTISMNARNGTFYDAKMFNKDLNLTEITNIL